MTKSPEHRAGAVRQAIESLGGRMLHFYYSLGEYDGPVIFEAPDATVAAAVALTALSSGGFKATKTTELLSAEHAVEAMRQTGAAAFQAPGRAE